MKKNILNLILTCAAFVFSTVHAQVGVGVPAENIHPSAELEVKSTAKGFLPPRMTKAERDAIVSPATGLLIYQTDNDATNPSGLYFFDGTTWKNGLGEKGDIGVNGKNTLVKTTSESQGNNCINGGTKIETGIDSNENGVLEQQEINVAQTKYVCNGAGWNISSGISGNGFESNVSLSTIETYQEDALPLMMKIDKNENLIIVGKFKEDLIFFNTKISDNTDNGGYFMLQISKQNTLNWVKNIGSILISPESVNSIDIDVDTLNNIYVCRDNKFEKYDVNGNLIYSLNYSNPRSVAVSNDQSVYLYCSKQDANIRLTKFSTNGSVLWDKTESINNISHHYHDMCVDVQGNPIVMYNNGIMCGGTGTFGLVLSKYSGSNGTILWSKYSQNTQNLNLCGSDFCTSICRDLNNDIFLFGNNIQISGVKGDILKVSSSGDISPTSTDILGNNNFIVNKNSTVLNKSKNLIYFSSLMRIYERTQIYNTNNLTSTLFNSSKNIVLDFTKNGKLFVVYIYDGEMPLNNLMSNISYIPGNSNFAIMYINP